MKRLVLLFAAIFCLDLAAHAGWFSGKKKDVEPPSADDSSKESSGWWPFGKKKKAKTAAGLPGVSGEKGMPYAPPDETSAQPPAEASASPSTPQPPPSDSVKTGANGLPTEVVIKAGEGAGNKLNVAKPPLAIEIDPYESIRESLKPDQSLLLAVSPLTVTWRRTHPEFLYSNRVVEPWRMTFSPKPGIAFRPLDQLSEVLERRVDDKEAKGYSWSLTIADEEGRVFHHYSGSGNPPSELLWSGQNDQGEWIHAGRSYSAVYTFTDPGGSPRTSVAKPLNFKGIVHQEESGLYISLDSSALFGSSKASSELAGPPSADLLRSASDLIKRRFTGIPVSVRVFASTKELGESQGATVVNVLVRDLMLMTQNVTASAARAPYSEQRVDIVLLNR